MQPLTDVQHATKEGLDLHFARIQQHPGDPNGAVWASIEGELCWNTTNNTLWQATGEGEVWVEIATDRWEDYRVDGYSARPGASAPSLESGWIGDPEQYYLSYAASGEDMVYLDLQMPHAWKEGTRIYPHVHYSPVAGGTGKVKFLLKYSAFTNFEGTHGAGGVLEMEDDIATPNQWGHRIARSVGGIDMTGKNISCISKCRLIRDNTVVGNYASAVSFEYLDAHHNVDSAGSRLQFTK